MTETMIRTHDGHAHEPPRFFCDGHAGMVAGRPTLRIVAPDGWVNGWDFCESCSFSYRVCVHCDEPVRFELTETRDGRDYCEPCHAETAPLGCYNCGCEIDREEVPYTDPSGDHFCEECEPETCCNCGDRMDESEVMHRDSDGDPYCRDCNPVAARCYNCSSEMTEDEIAYRDRDGDAYCERCEHRGMEYDGGHDDDYDDEYDDDEGASAGAGYRRMDSRITNAGVGRGYGETFGVEVEVLFRHGSPWRLGGYSSDCPAPAEFFGGWRGEKDCTVDGEFISPPLAGPEGVAEIVATYRTLRAHGAHTNSDKAGQHITVSAPDGSYAGAETQRVMYILEEAMLALSGSYERLTGPAGRTNFSRRLKFSGSRLADGLEDHTREITCNLRSGHLAEFRYPPGTLDGSQFAINLGLSRLVMHIAATADAEEIDDYFTESRRIQLSDMARHEKVHEQILLGLMLISEYGWTRGGDMTGLPYDPNGDAPQVDLTDHANGNETTVTVPSGDEIFGRMHASLGRFYDGMCESSGDMNVIATMLEQAHDVIWPASVAAIAA